MALINSYCTDYCFIIFTIYRFANSSLLSKYSIEAGTDRRRNNKNAPISKKTNNYRI